MVSCFLFFFKLFFCYKYPPLCNFYLTGIRHALCSSAFLCEFSALAIRKVAFYFHHSYRDEISAKKRQLQKLEMRTMLIVCGKDIKSGNGRTDNLRRVSGYRDVLLLNICFKVFIRIKRMSLFPLIDCLFSPRRLIANVMLIISLDLCGIAEKLKITIMLGISFGIRYSCYVFCSEIMYLPGFFCYDFNF